MNRKVNGTMMNRNTNLNASAQTGLASALALRASLLGLVGFVGCVTLALAIAGCGKPEPDAAPSDSESTATTSVDPSHGGWWCVEHGVPEDQCPLCDKSLVSDFKSKGDWCEKHNRPASQCFICSPENAEPFIALYEAKTGHKPPEPHDNRPETNE